MVTMEQQRVFDDAVKLGLVKTSKEAYEAGCAILRRQLQDLKTEREETDRAEAEAIAALQGNLF